ncbi:hypothetical protein CFC21_003877 [Triticum aestivum]|uniref:F-box domain-containing protein n=1 Tax=Triticum aestivum TaxID=4565 RepID=A0A3B5Y5K5_WHEAT|nr:hypothetical protein CFC21_003877 [Triticum aestivum]
MDAESKPPAPTTLHDVPDRLLEPILARLMASPLCLARAAATCKRWRRIMGRTRFFLSEVDRVGYRQAPQPRPVAGNYRSRLSSLGGREFVFVPTPPAARYGIKNSHFSLDFLPGGCRKWEVVDTSRSLVLLAKKRKGAWMRRCFPSLLVCEPATRRYQLIPRMEEMKHHRCLGSYLVGTERCTEFKPSGDRRLLDTMQTFKVVCVAYQGHDRLCDDVGSARACIFARKTEVRKGRPETHTWYAERSRCLGYNYNAHLHGADSLHFLGHAEGSLFWSIKGDKECLVSYGGPWLPENFNGTVLRVTDDSAYENVQFVCLQGSTLQIFVIPTVAYLSIGWELHKSLELMEATRGLTGYKEEYFDGSLKVVMTSPKFIVLALENGTWLFSIDLDTMEVAKCNHKTVDHLGILDFPCELPWPPTLRACVGSCVRQGQGPCSHACIC